MTVRPASLFQSPPLAPASQDAGGFFCPADQGSTGFHVLSLCRVPAKRVPPWEIDLLVPERSRDGAFPASGTRSADLFFAE